MTFQSRNHGKPCCYCERVMDRNHRLLYPTRDHETPRVLGGNVIVVSCAQCNTIKAAMTPEEWETFMHANPRWWLLSKHAIRNAKRALEGLPLRPRKVRKRRRTHAPGSPRTTGVSVVVPPALIWPPPDTENPGA